MDVIIGKNQAASGGNRDMAQGTPDMSRDMIAEGDQKTTCSLLISDHHDFQKEQRSQCQSQSHMQDEPRRKLIRRSSDTHQHEIAKDHK